jgi:hypothetical protein
MMRRVLVAAFALPLTLSLGGCLYETNLNAKGGGTITVTRRLNDKKDLAKLEPQMKSSAVKLTSAKLSDDGKSGVYAMAFDDITKLSTVAFFKNVAITRSSEKEKGTVTITAKYKNSKPGPLPDKIVQFYSNEAKLVATFPGPVTESNGKVSGNTVTWSWEINEFYKQPEVVLKATYKEEGTGKPGS